MSRAKSSFLSALAGGLVAALVMSVVPVGAAAGEPVVLGQKNFSARNTVIKGKGTTVFSNKADEPAASFKVTAGAPFLVNSTAKVDGLNADMVDGRHAVEFLPRTGTARNARHADEADDADALQGYAANQLLRVTQGNTSNAPDGNGIAVQASITAPGPGWLILSGSIDGRGDAYDVYVCDLWIDDTVIPNSGRTSTVDVDAFGALNDEENCSTDGVMSVTAGEHTVSLRTMRVFDKAKFGSATVWALFVPFNGQGKPHNP